MSEDPRNVADLVGQETATGILRAALRERRIGHAYLFVGPEGVGKLTAAMLFAKTLDCEGERPPDEACGACKSCMRFAHGSHPQIWRIAPMYRRQPITDPRLLELVEDQAWITIAQTRGDGREHPPHPPVLREAMRKAIFSPYKVFVFEPADRMTEEAADSLLATLEEPPPGTVFILVTSRPGALRETVVSRCEQVRFHIVGPQAVAQLLRARGVEGQAAELIAGLADGRPGRAIRMAERPQILALRAEAVELAQEVCSAPAQAALALSARTQELAWRWWETEFDAVIAEEREEVEERPAPASSGASVRRSQASSPEEAGTTRSPRRRRETAAEPPTTEAEKMKISYVVAMRRTTPLVLDMMTAFLRDVMVVKAGRPELMVNRDFADQARALAARTTYDGLREAVEALRRAQGYIRSYVNLDPALEAMYVETQAALSGGVAPA